MHSINLAAEKINPLLPHTTELIAGAIAFLVLFLVLRAKVMPMFEKAFTARTEAIQGGMEKAEKAQIHAERALRQYTEQLSKARDEAHTLREEARSQGVAIVEELRVKAKEEASRITAAAHASIEAERQASKIVGEALDDQARASRVVDRFLDDLEKSK
jgi:F-type H+-transporting ATPase subunit b